MTIISALNKDFETWWRREGSAPPSNGRDHEEHTQRMCWIAWENGASTSPLVRRLSALLKECLDHPSGQYSSDRNWDYDDFERRAIVALLEAKQ